MNFKCTKCTGKESPSVYVCVSPGWFSQPRQGQANKAVFFVSYLVVGGGVAEVGAVRFLFSVE